MAEKLCPVFAHAILSNPNFERPHDKSIDYTNFKCLESKCGWYDQGLRACTVIGIGNGLSLIANNILELKEEDD
jgi:hypothetical protein